MGTNLGSGGDKKNGTKTGKIKIRKGRNFHKPAKEKIRKEQ